MKIPELINRKRQCFDITVLILSIMTIIFFLSGCSTTNIKSLDFSSSYIIDAQLDPENRTLKYTQQAKIGNAGDDSTKELYFHLYGNMYKTDEASIAVVSVSDDSGNHIAFKMEDDDQLIRLTLNNALESGEEITLTFTCEVIIPVMESVYGISRDGEIQMPFFYPQLAIYDENGWNTESLFSAGDGRYAEMSDYYITIQVPSEYEVACTGTELAREEIGGHTIYAFQAENRRDIVFAAFTDYTRMERTVGDTTILGYFNNSKSEASMEQVMDAAAVSMECYGKVYMEYPYDTLVVVSGGWETKNFASMEYSGFFTVNMYDEPDAANIENTYHEMAHQWFYFLVGNNECKEPWLDESFATFSVGICLEETDDDYSESYWLRQELPANAAEGKTLNCSYDEAEQYATLFYANLFYGRGAIFLKELRDTLGQGEFLSILSDYCKTYAYEIVTTQDFLDILREEATVDVADIIGKYIF